MRAEDARRASDEDSTMTPSQAEGDRETVEESLGEDESGRGDAWKGGQGDMTPTPSQAEGEREKIERDLEEKQGRE